MIPCQFYYAMSKIFCHGNIDLVNTYLFYQVCKVHNIFYFWDQSANV